MIRIFEDLILIIEEYSKDYDVFVGVDAPLFVDNETGNRDIEKAFLKDFSTYKIGMLPVNRTLLLRQFGFIKGEELYLKLKASGFTFGCAHQKNIVEVYPHSTIAVLFNNNAILPYKRKNGRNVDDVRKALIIYQGYLKSVINEHSIFDVNILMLKGKGLKEYEDKLDAIVSAYTLYYYQINPQKCKVYKGESGAIFITPFPS
jgi:predicted RNase H-like nuclease